MMEYNGVGQRIKELRENAEMTQAEIGKIAGVSNKAVWAWENGTALPRMGALQRIADHFGVSCSWIIEGDSEIARLAKANVCDNALFHSSSEKAAILIEKIKNMNDAQITRLERLMLIAEMLDDEEI